MHMYIQVIQGDLGQWLLKLRFEGEEIDDLVGRFIRPEIGVTNLHLHTHTHEHTQYVYLCMYIHVCMYMCRHVCMYAWMCACVCM